MAASGEGRNGPPKADSQGGVINTLVTSREN